MFPQYASTDTVVLRYTLTSQDLVDGFAAKHRAVNRSWLLRWLGPILVTAVMTVVFLYKVITAEAISGPAVVAFGVLLLVVTGFVVALHLLMTRLVGPSVFYRLPVRQMMRGNPEFFQPMQVTLTSAGLHLTNASGESAIAWARHPFHIETDQLFVLLASRNRGAAVLVLPKRGLGSADVEPLRALLAAHTQRLD